MWWDPQLIWGTDKWQWFILKAASGREGSPGGSLTQLCLEGALDHITWIGPQLRQPNLWKRSMSLGPFHRDVNVHVVEYFQWLMCFFFCVEPHLSSAVFSMNSTFSSCLRNTEVDFWMWWGMPITVSREIRRTMNSWVTSSSVLLINMEEGIW